jgi:hypothetical protein
MNTGDKCILTGNNFGNKPLLTFTAENFGD